MKRKKLLALIGSICLILVLASLPLMGACAKPAPAPAPAPAPTPAPEPTPAPAEKIVIKAVTAFPPSAPDIYAVVPFFVDMVNERAGGRLKIDWLGGPEVIPSFDQGDAVQAGVVDMLLYQPQSYLTGLVPEAWTEGLSEYMPWEDRQVGINDLLDECFRKRMNATYLGRMCGFPVQFHVYSNVKITKMADFKGLIFRVQPLYIPIMEYLGVSCVTLPPTEVYTSMERGTVDGFLWPAGGITAWSAQEVTKYELWPGLWQMGAVTLVNLDTWNEIPKDLQDLMTKCMIEAEYIGIANRGWISELEWKDKMLPAGMTRIYLAEEEQEEFIRLSYEKTWEKTIKESPEYGPKLRELMTREKWEYITPK